MVARRQPAGSGLLNFAGRDCSALGDISQPLRRPLVKVSNFPNIDEEGVQMVFREIANANRPGVRLGVGAPKRHLVLRSPPREFRVQAVAQRNALVGEGLLHIP